jgi:hypothetical protein
MMSKKTTLMDRATDRVADTWSDTVDRMLPAVESAREAVEEFIDGTARPAVATARDTASTVAREKAAPLVATGAGLAAQKAGALATRAEDFSAPKKNHRGLKLLAVLGLLGIVGAIITKRINDNKLGGSDSWSTGSTGSSGYPAAARTTDDPGGASPDEALADDAEEPKRPTTPDSPAELIDLPADNRHN